MNEFLCLAIDGPIARLRIDRPAKRNAFCQAMWQAMPGLIDTAMAAPGVRVLLLESATPGVFCAGADIAEFARHAPDPEWRAGNQAAIATTQHRLARAARPVIAVIDGDCVGGGCGLALACDIRIASPRSRFGITPAKLGLVYSLHDTKLLVDLVGPAQASRILFSAGLIDAAEATRIGLVTLLADDAAAAATALAETMAAVSPFTQVEAKRIIRRIRDGEACDTPQTAALFDSAFTGPDFAEGVAAFLARRPPVFAGR
jgi:enoyl-CoA hydratase/carnithine racemase